MKTTSMLSSAASAPGTPASAAAARAISSHMANGSGAPSGASAGCQVLRATPMMQADRGSTAGLIGSYGWAHGAGLLFCRLKSVRDWPGMAMARSAMMFFWISVDPPPMVL